MAGSKGPYRKILSIPEHDVHLWRSQVDDGNFVVVYGLQQGEFQGQVEAFTEVGLNLRHAVECDGLLDAQS